MDEPLDPPWPGDMTEQEAVEIRQARLAKVDRETIREMVNEAMEDEMVDIINRHLIQRVARTPEYVTVCAELDRRIRAQTEQWLDNED